MMAADAPTLPTSDNEINEADETFFRLKHIKFFLRNLDILPTVYTSADTSR